MHGETFLCIAPRAWHSLWRESQQIMSRIARQNRVLYFDPGRDYERPHLAEMRRNLPNFWSLQTKKLGENLTLISTPSSLPIARQHLPRSVLRLTTPFVVRINARILVRHVRRTMKALDVKHPILWLQDPYTDLVGKFGEKLACYYNYDELADFAQNVRIKQFLRQLDRQMTRRVDVVFATSRAQWRQRQTINAHTYFVPNGVDFEMFNRALVSKSPLPSDIAHLPRPIIGFAGWLSYYIDADLLCKVADAYPGCSLVLVGPDNLADGPARQRLQALPNVFFLGQKERADLPKYLQAFDVALMPYGNSEHLRSAYPLKLHEYLAAGRAIVATELPELEPYNEIVHIARTHTEFIRHIGEALDDYAPQTIAKRVAVARQNTWDHRVAAIYDVLQDHLGWKQIGSERVGQIHDTETVPSIP